MFLLRVVALLLLACAAASAKTPAVERTDAYLDTDNIRTIALLRSLSDDRIGEKIEGLTLQDGTWTLRNAVFLGSLIVPFKKQHIYTFKVSGRESSWVWIEPGGTPLDVPFGPKTTAGAHAFALSGDAYRSGEVRPGVGVIVLPGGSKKWLRQMQAEVKAYDKAGLR